MPQAGPPRELGADQRLDPAATIPANTAAMTPRSAQTLAAYDAAALVAYARLMTVARGTSASAGEAMRHCRRANELDPVSADVATAYAHALHTEGYITEAAHMYGRALRVNAGDGTSQPAHHPDALAGAASLLLSHPAVCQALLEPTAGLPATVDATSSSLDGQQHLSSTRVERRRRNEDGRADTSDPLDTDTDARRRLSRAIALAPSSPACADVIRGLFSRTLQCTDEDSVGMHAGDATPHAAEAAMLQQGLRQQESRAKDLLQQHMRALLHLQSVQTRRDQAQRRPIAGRRTCSELSGLCLCAHTECANSRTCLHFQTSAAAPRVPENTYTSTASSFPCAGETARFPAAPATAVTAVTHSVIPQPPPEDAICNIGVCLLVKEYERERAGEGARERARESERAKERERAREGESERVRERARDGKERKRERERERERES